MTTTYLIVDGDWVMDSNTGRPLTVEAGEKLSQDLSELFATDVQSNGFGTGLDAIIGTVPASPAANALNVQLLMVRGVNRMMQLQRRQFTERPANERIVRINAFSATPFAARGVSATEPDPTALYVTMDVATADGVLTALTGVLD